MQRSLWIALTHATLSMDRVAGISFTEDLSKFQQILEQALAKSTHVYSTSESNSNGSLFFFAELHSLHAGTKFALIDFPPFARGMR
ncbi:HNH endonuclease domain protein [Leptospira kirschneri serovar Mozdok]|nr:HNH endonuclease domain protein [Leptospira kirschneri serovar Mozdok]NDK04391.1 hypothetical protein [Leptospira kirschneri serovar Mozdok]